MNKSDIFNKNSVANNLKRASIRFNNYDYLFKEVAERTSERLLDINKQFNIAAEIGSRGNILSNIFLKKKINEKFAINTLHKFHQFGQEGDARIDNESLPLRKNSLNLIISNLSLHTVNDLPGVLLQINNALKPDGLFIGSIFGGQTLFELRKIFHEADLLTSGKIFPRVSPFLDIKDAGNLLQRAGFSLVVADIDKIEVQFTNLKKLFYDLRYMGEANSMTKRKKNFSTKSFFNQANQLYKEYFTNINGKLTATFEIIYFSGWAPDKSQQKPLKPGSGLKSLSEVL
tara:strand:- start:1251 stop:2111 length:861 start_codon:yes stop_codon:yes gene_type:complete